MPFYTKSQLALRNGQDKPEIWVAFAGKIFDMTTSKLWKNGKHYEHWAGQDLTEELAAFPKATEYNLSELIPPPPSEG